MKADSYSDMFDGVETVMVVMPHPDDTELYCGGTIARLLSNGIEVVCIKVTNGGKGTKQTEITEKELELRRSAEDKRAAQALGLKTENNIQLGIPDGEVQDDLATIEQIALYIRQYRPDVIITCNPEDVIIRFAEGANWVNHRDHRSTAQAAIDAAYPYSRDKAFFPHQFESPLKDYKPTAKFLLADYYDHPDVAYVEITNFVNVKRQAWQCHENAYTAEAVDDSIEYLNKDEETGGYFETFRVVEAD